MRPGVVSYVNGFDLFLFSAHFLSSLDFVHVYVFDSLWLNAEVVEGLFLAGVAGR